jgi:hypothetical protein
MGTSSREHEPGVQQGQKNVWGNRMILVNLIKWLVDIIYPQLSDEEREAAGIYSEHQGDE